MIDKKLLRSIAITNGIRFDHMTIYRAELIHLRNDKVPAHQIASMINSALGNDVVNQDMIAKWYSKQVQPKEKIVEILERMLFSRYGVSYPSEVKIKRQKGKCNERHKKNS